MSGLDQLQYLSWLVYLVVFVTVLLRTVRRPTPAHVDMTLFFGAVAVVIVLTTLGARLHIAQPAWLFDDLVTAAAMSFGYLLLRLVRDFSSVPTWLVRIVELGLAVALVAVVILPPPLPPALALLLVGYLVLVIAYDTLAFARQARRTRGVTRRRMQAAAVGTLTLVLALVNSGVRVALPDQADSLQQLGAALGLVSGSCYFIAFAPPNWLRRAWQEPELRSFLAMAASLPRLPSMRSMVYELERGAADALGAQAANIALWDAASATLQIYTESRGTAQPVGTGDERVYRFDPAARPISGRAFIEQRASLVTDAARADPANAETLEQFGAHAIMSAPITAGDRRLGVLIVYAPRAPVFADADLQLIQLLADHAAVILESHALIDEAASVRAREEATMLKEDFLSSAAHDLKTPLTGLITQAQVLQRRAMRNPQAPVDRAGIDRLLGQSLRLRDLVLELLDVTRLEQGGLLGERRPLDLVELVQTAVDREPDWGRVDVEAEGNATVMALLDATRFEQVLMNLIENALKYSPHDSPVNVRIWVENGESRISVRDEGIGIPLDDQPLVFDRFHRARNVDDRRYAGMGLGLYIARGIVEQHGGRIWVDSMPGNGSTFFVALPGLDSASKVESEAPSAAHSSAASV